MSEMAVPLSIDYRTQSSGFKGLSSINEQTNQHQETALVPKYVTGPEGKVEIIVSETAEIQAPEFKTKKLHIKAKNIKLLSLSLHFFYEATRNSINLNFLGASTIQALGQGNLEKAFQSFLNEFPAISSMQEMLNAKDLADLAISGPKTFYHAYQMYQAYQEAKTFEEFLQGQLDLNPKIRIGHSTETISQTKVVVPQMMFDEALFEADSIDAEGLNAQYTKILQVHADNIVLHTAIETMSHELSDDGLTVGYSLSSGIPNIGIDSSTHRSYGTYHVPSILVGPTTELIAKNKLIFSGVMQGQRVKLIGKTTELTTVQDYESSNNSSLNFSSTLDGHYSKGSSYKRWANTQTEINMQESLEIESEVLTLKGVKLTCKETPAIIKANHINKEDIEDEATSKQFNVGFSASGILNKKAPFLGYVAPEFKRESKRQSNRTFVEGESDVLPCNASDNRVVSSTRKHLGLFLSVANVAKNTEKKDEFVKLAEDAFLKKIVQESNASESPEVFELSPDQTNSELVREESTPNNFHMPLLEPSIHTFEHAVIPDLHPTKQQRIGAVLKSVMLKDDLKTSLYSKEIIPDDPLKLFSRRNLIRAQKGIHTLVSRLETAIPLHSNPKFPIPFKSKNFDVDNDPTFAINESFDYKTRIPVRIKASFNGNDVFSAIGRGLGAACDNLIDLAKNPQDIILAPLNLVVDGMVMRDANQYKTYKTIFNNTPVDPDIGKFARDRMNLRIDHVAGSLRHFYNASALDKIEMLTEFGATVYVPGKIASGIKFLKPSVLRETTLVKKLGLGVEWEYLYRGDETLKKNIVSAMTRQNDSTFTKAFLKELSPGALSDLYYNHAFCNEGTPFVSTSKNARVAAYFAKGKSQIQQGYVTTIRISKNKFYKMLSSNELIPNFESPMFLGINHNIGLSESEYLFTDRIPKKYIHKQIKVEDFNPYDPHPNVRKTHKALGSTLQGDTVLTISTGNVTMPDTQYHFKNFSKFCQFENTVGLCLGANDSISLLTPEQIRRTTVTCVGMADNNNLDKTMENSKDLSSHSNNLFKDKALSFFEKVFLPAQAKANEAKSCQRPYYDDAISAFKEVSGYANFESIGEIIGGKVKQNLDSGIFQNACAIRGSRLFNAPQIKSQINCSIPRIKGETVTGGDGLQYIYRVQTLIKFLKQAWGPPDYDSRKDRLKPTETHGAVIYLMPEEARHGYTGHFEVNDNMNSFYRDEAVSILFWHLPRKKVNAVSMKQDPQNRQIGRISNL